MSNLTKEECLKAFDDIKFLGSVNVPLSSLDLIEKLINEHFENPPLKFEELKPNMWIWDDYVQTYKRIKLLYSHLSNGMRYKCVSYYPVVDSDGIEINLKHNRFEKGRFYAKKVKED